MAQVSTKCPNCGGTMGIVDNQLKCPNCRTMILNIVDAKIDADVTVMSPDEFAKKIEESKRQFVVNINDRFEVFDVETRVINKKIKDATEFLQDGKFDSVNSALSGVPENILSAERLRYLAGFHVKNEQELSSIEGTVDKNTHYDNILKLADEQTKQTYLLIAKHCQSKYDEKLAIDKRISETQKLLAVKLYDDACIYATEMCRLYPMHINAWLNLANTKRAIQPNYNCDYEYFMMRQCPDFPSHTLPQWFADKIKKRYGYGVELSTQMKEDVVASLKWYGTFWLFCLSPAGILLTIALAPVIALLFVSPIFIIPFRLLLTAHRHRVGEKIENGKFPDPLRASKKRNLFLLIALAFSFISLTLPGFVYKWIHFGIFIAIISVVAILFVISAILSILYMKTCFGKEKTNQRKAKINIVICFVGIVAFITISILSLILSTGKTYKLSDVRDFQLFKNLPSAEKCNYILENDIDFQGEDASIWGYITYFYGTFDGDGHTIKNLQYNEESRSTKQYFRYFSESFYCNSDGFVRVNYGTIKNLNFQDCVFKIKYEDLGATGYYAKCESYLGIISGQNGGNIRNCTITNCFLQCKLGRYVTYTSNVSVGVNYAYKPNVSIDEKSIRQQGSYQNVDIMCTKDCIVEEGYHLVD